MQVRMVLFYWALNSSLRIGKAPLLFDNGDEYHAGENGYFSLSSQ
jgi:hypothetical protein